MKENAGSVQLLILEQLLFYCIKQMHTWEYAIDENGEFRENHYLQVEPTCDFSLIIKPVTRSYMKMHKVEVEINVPEYDNLFHIATVEGSLKDVFLYAISAITDLVAVAYENAILNMDLK